MSGVGAASVSRMAGIWLPAKTSAAAWAAWRERKRRANPIRTPQDCRSWRAISLASACASRRTLSSVKPSPIRARQPPVPKAIRFCSWQRCPETLDSKRSGMRGLFLGLLLNGPFSDGDETRQNDRGDRGDQYPYEELLVAERHLDFPAHRSRNHESQVHEGIGERVVRSEEHTSELQSLRHLV